MMNCVYFNNLKNAESKSFNNTCNIFIVVYFFCIILPKYFIPVSVIYSLVKIKINNIFIYSMKFYEKLSTIRFQNQKCFLPQFNHTHFPHYKLVFVQSKAKFCSILTPQIPPKIIFLHIL